MANDLERMADYASNVGTYILNTQHDNAMFRTLMLEYKEVLSTMIDKSLAAFKEEDVKSAFRVCEMDNQVDVLYNKHIKSFINIAKTKTDI